MIKIFKCTENAKHRTMMGGRGNKSQFKAKSCKTRSFHVQKDVPLLPISKRKNKFTFIPSSCYIQALKSLDDTCTGEGDLYVIRMQTLMSCGNALTDPSKNNIHQHYFFT